MALMPEAAADYVFAKVKGAGFKKHGGQGPDVEDFVKTLTSGIMEYVLANNQVQTAVTTAVTGSGPTGPIAGAGAGTGTGKMI